MHSKNTKTKFLHVGTNEKIKVTYSVDGNTLTCSYRVHVDIRYVFSCRGN